MGDRDMGAVTLPPELIRLLRRLENLEDGRTQIIITKDKGEIVDCTVTRLGKVENLKRPRPGTP